MRANQRLELIFDIGDQEIGYLEKSDFNNICAQLRALFSDSLFFLSILNLIGRNLGKHTPNVDKIPIKKIIFIKILLFTCKYMREMGISSN